MEDPQADISQFWIERMDGRIMWDASQAIWNGESLFMEKKRNEEIMTVLREEPRAILCQVLENALDSIANKLYGHPMDEEFKRLLKKQLIAPYDGTNH